MDERPLVAGLARLSLHESNLIRLVPTWSRPSRYTEISLNVGIGFVNGESRIAGGMKCSTEKSRERGRRSDG